MHLWSHVDIWADFNKLFNKKCMHGIVLSRQQSTKKSSSVTTQRRPLRKHYKGHRGDWINQVYTKSNLTRVLSMTWTKYETGFPVQETARPWGFSSETCNIVPISRNQIEKIWRFKECLKKDLPEIKQASYPFLNKKFKDFSRTFKEKISHFSRTPLRAKRALTLCLF